MFAPFIFLPSTNFPFRNISTSNVPQRYVRMLQQTCLFLYNAEAQFSKHSLISNTTSCDVIRKHFNFNATITTTSAPDDATASIGNEQLFLDGN